jgi:hypothetical protein
MLEQHKYLLECVNHSTEDTMKNIVNKSTDTLKELIHNALDHADVLVTLVIEYSKTCYYCHNYIDEKDVKHCYC